MARIVGGSVVLVVALALAGCSSGGSEGAGSTSSTAAAPSTSSTSSTSTTTSTTEPRTTTTLPGPQPADQLAGLRPYAEGEGCGVVLALLNAPTFPEALRDRFAAGFSGFVSSAGVVDITAKSDPRDDADFDYFGFVSAVAGSEVDQTIWFRRIEPAQPPAGTPTWTAEFTRGDDGVYTCTTFANLGGE